MATGTLSKELIEQVQAKVREQDAYPMIKANQRHVMLVGRTRAGKTTAMEVLKDPTHQPAPMSIFSQTKEPRFQMFSIKNKQTSVMLNVVDTPGVFEVVTAGNSARTNEKITESIGACIERETTRVHVLAIFISLIDGLNTNDLAAVKLFTELFQVDQSNAPAMAGTASAEAAGKYGADGEEARQMNIALCVSHADAMSQERRDSLRADLEKQEDLGPLIKGGVVKVFFVGAVDASNADSFATHMQFADANRDIVDLRAQFLDYIFESKDFVSLRNLKVVTKRTEEVKEAMVRMTDNFKTFGAQKDNLNTPEMLKLMETHVDDGRFVARHRGYVKVAEATALSAALSDAGTVFNNGCADALDRPQRRKLLFPLRIGTPQELAADEAADRAEADAAAQRKAAAEGAGASSAAAAAAAAAGGQ